MSKAIFETGGVESPCVLTRRARRKVVGQEYGVAQVKRFGRTLHSAHVLSWVDHHGMLPPADAPHILHTCDNPPCINPQHLYAGTDADNTRDKMTRGRHTNGQREKTHCVNGHEFTPENTRIWAKDGSRICKTCHAAAELRRYHRLRAESEGF